MYLKYALALLAPLFLYGGTAWPAQAADDSWANEAGGGYELPAAPAPKVGKRREQTRAEAIAEVQPLIDWQKSVEQKINTTKIDMPPECHGGLCTRKPAVIGFNVERDGRIVDQVISKSSGDDVVDRYAMAFVNKLSPFRPIPVALRGKPHVHYEVPVYFGKRDK
ncbi:MAG: energy transducer TonB family protein [Parvibaculaceae bacterium]